MPHHTISPTPDSSGLGITYSTLSPPVDQPTPPRFTGMVGIAPRHSPSRVNPALAASPSRRPLPSQPSASPSRPHPSLAASSRGAPLFQPTFALRPTHTHARTSSAKGFTSFSAIPPVAAASTSHVHTRQPAHEDSESGHSDVTERADEPPRQPSRNPSVASASTSASTHSRQARRSKSSEILRRFSRNSHDTISGGKYLPLSGQDDTAAPFPSANVVGQNMSPDSENGDDDEERTPSARDLALPPGAAPPEPQSTLVEAATPFESMTPSSTSATPSQSLAHSSSAGSFNPTSFPLPPQRANSADSYRAPAYQQGMQGGMMPRSLSQPQHLQSVPEAPSTRSSSFARPLPRPVSHGSSEHSNPSNPKRISDPATGIHSKNAVLLNAERGGVMLAFSPTGDGTWREGEQIYGQSTNLIPTPPSVPRQYFGDDGDGRPFQPPRRPSHHGRSLSDGAQLLNRQGTLFHPSSSSQRASAELSLMLGGTKSRRLSGNRVLPPPEQEAWVSQGGGTDKVRLEAAKKRKARVEVDVVLERECVVEGGEVRGRMEIRVSGGKRGDGLRVGAGKIRVVGFEDISPTSRHIFYHHPHPLPIFTDPPHTLTSTSLFASAPDSEGFLLAREGTHSIPFRFRLPLGGGAKGSYSPPQGSKGPCVRYVVVGSIKIHMPSTGKRSIAHFYRQIVVLPYLNPAVVLAPSSEVAEGVVERGLGWGLGGEKGRVELRVALGRRTWVAGQRMWCEVAIRNDSAKKIKSIHLALLQTVQTFNPQPLLEPAAKRLSHLGIKAQRGETPPGTPDADACQTNTTRRKMAEEVVEADFGGWGGGRVTGKGWWTGVEPGEWGKWDLSLLVPNGLLSMRRTRLIEVQYTLRVTLNSSSIYVDVPINLINFLSIDPPPMPGDCGSMPAPVGVPTQVYQGSRPGPQRMRSDESLGAESGMGAAIASSTTLHIDALLQAGRARAQAEGQGEETRAKARPVSLVSTYTLDPARPGHARSQSTNTLTPQKVGRPGVGGRLMSYMSDTGSIFSSEIEEGEEEELDAEAVEEEKARINAMIARGRQRSLAMIMADEEREREERELEEEELEHARQQNGSGSGTIKSRGGVSVDSEQWRPAGSPEEGECVDMGGDTPRVSAAGDASRRGSEATIPMDSTNVSVDPHAQAQAVKEEDRIEEEEGDEEAENGRGDETMLEQDLIQEIEEIEAEAAEAQAEIGREDEPEPEADKEPHGYDMDHRGDGDRSAEGYDYSDEIERSPNPSPSAAFLSPASASSFRQQNPRVSLPHHLPDLSLDSEEIDITPPGYARERMNSFANSAVSGVSEEEGVVHEAVKREMSMRLPLRLPPQPGNKNMKDLRVDTSGNNNYLLDVPGQRRSSHTPPPTHRRESTSSRTSFNGARRGSVPNTSMANISGRHDSSCQPPVSSPLRNTLPASVMLAPHGQGESMARQHSSPGKSSALRHEISVSSLPSPTGSDSDDGGDGDGRVPGLAPSVASDSASSDNHALESPPPVMASISTMPMRLPLKPAEAYHHPSGGSPEDQVKWAPGAGMDHLRHLEVNYLTAPPQPRSQSLRPSSPVHSEDSHHSHASTRTGESTTLVPSGVRSRIAQLESRDEALRKFSLSGASPAPLPGPASPPSNNKRRSYTAALAPRPVRSTSDDSVRPPLQHVAQGQGLGHTTYIPRRSYVSPQSERPSFSWTDGSGGGSQQHQQRLDPFKLLQRHDSASSVSTTATSVEAALRNGGRLSASLGPGGPGGGDGSTRSRASGISPRTGPGGPRMMDYPPFPSHITGWRGDGVGAGPGGRGVLMGREGSGGSGGVEGVLKRASGITHDSEDSEGLL